MADFLSAFIFILPGIMAYFWLQVFGFTPTVKHTAPEISGIASLLWLPVSFITLLFLNILGFFLDNSVINLKQVWTIDDFSIATSDIRYLVAFLIFSFIFSYFICLLWGVWGFEKLNKIINKVRKKRRIAPLSSSTTVWEEFFIKIKNKDDEDKIGVFVIHKVDKPEDFIAGSMTNGSRPLENDKALVLEEVQTWEDSIKYDYDYDVLRAYIDTKSGMVVKELDYKNPKPKRKAIPE